MKNLFKILLLLLLGSFSISCSNHYVEGSAGFSSYGDRGDEDTETGDVQNTLLKCVSFQRNGFVYGAELNGRVKQFINAVGDLDYRYLRLRFSELPNEFTSNKYVIRFFRGKQNIGDTITDFQESFYDNQVRFDVERAENNVQSMVSFDNDDLRNEVDILGGFDLREVTLVLDFDLYNGGYQALQIVAYEKVQEDRDFDGSPETYLVARNNAIILAPPFLASPDLYAEKQAGKDVLISLHPFISQIGQGISQQSFYEQSQSSCF